MSPDDSSISASALRACKQLVSSQGRSVVRTLLTDLNVSQYADGRPGRGGFGYYARQFGSQFSGLLGLDARRSTLGTVLGALPPLASGERSLLLQVHRELVLLNHRCVDGCAQLAPGILEAMNPYAGLPSDSFLAGENKVAVGYEYLPSDACAQIAGAFQRSALIEGLRRTPAAIRAAFQPAQLLLDVTQLDRLLRTQAVAKRRDEFTAIAFQTPKNYPPRQALYYHAALAGIRASLSILNQLLYQAFTIDRLPAVNENALVNVDGPSTSVAETVVAVTVQPNDNLGHARPGEIVYFSHPRMPQSLNGLAEILSTRSQMSHEAGYLSYLSLHMLDEDLNPSPLFRSLLR